MTRIFINTDLNNTAEIENRYFQQHDAEMYSGSIEEACEEMQHWVNQGWATTEATAENTEEVTPEQMQALIQEHVLRD